MAADQTAALVVKLSADFKDFSNQMKQATGVFDSEARKIAARQEKLRKELGNWAIDFTGLKGIGAAIAGFTAVEAVKGLFEFTKSSLETAAAIGDTSKAAGVSVERLQELRFAASQTGASFALMDQGLITLNRNFGEFINTGGGRAAAAFKQLKIDQLINSGDVRNSEQAFDAIVKNLQNVGSEAQKASLLAKLFGQEAGPRLLELLNQGASGIDELSKKANDLGIVLSTNTVRGATEANNKLQELFQVLKFEGVAAIAELAPQIAELVQQLEHGLPTLIQWVEKWADYFGLIKLSPVQRLQQQIADIDDQLDKQTKGALSPGLLERGADALNGNAFFKGRIASIDELLKKRQQLQDQLLQANANAPLPASTGPKADEPKLHVAATQEEIALKQKQDAFVTQQQQGAEQAAASLLVAQDKTNVQLLKGQEGYHQAVLTEINDQFAAKVAAAQKELALNESKNAELKLQGQALTDAGIAEAQKFNDAVAEARAERDAALDKNSNAAQLRDANIEAKEAIQNYADQTAQLGLQEGALARIQFIQDQINLARRDGRTLTAEETAAIIAQGDAVGAAAQNYADASTKIRDSIQLSDAFRQGLMDVATAGLKGFGSLKDAASRFLEQMAEMVLQLYVLRPLMESVFGKQGTDLFGGGGGGGGGGDILGSILSIGKLFFADGGYTGNGSKYQAAGIVHKGEFVLSKEAVRRLGIPALEALQRGYADGGFVGNSLPVVSPRSSSSGNNSPIVFDLRGAVVTEDLLRQMNQIAATTTQQGIRSYDRNSLPARVDQLNKFPRRAH